MGPTRVNRKLSNECFESDEEQIKGYGKVTQNTEIFSTKYGNNISEVGSPVRGTRTPNLRIHAECSNLLSCQGQTFAVPCIYIYIKYIYIIYMAIRSDFQLTYVP